MQRRLARRVWGLCVGVLALGLGLVGLFAMPDNCRILSYIAAAIVIPGGLWVIFASLRGRKSDLEDLSLANTADTAATEVAGSVLSEIIDKLT